MKPSGEKRKRRNWYNWSLEWFAVAFILLILVLLILSWLNAIGNGVEPLEDWQRQELDSERRGR